MVKISVIVPVFNAEVYLDECLSSIINQSFQDIEIICVNDGSTDSSLNILKKYQQLDSRIRLFSQKNAGLGSARNRGLDNACGDYIYFIDADDYLSENALAELYEISKDKNSDLVLFKLINFDDKTKIKDYNYSNMPFLKNLDVFNYKDFKKDLFRVDVTVYTKFFKKELISNKRFAEGLFFEDNLFYINYIFDAQRIYFHDKCLYNRRIRTDSIINGANEKHSDVIIIFNEIEKVLKKRNLFEEFKEEWLTAKLSGCYNRYSLSSSDYKSLFFDKIKKDLLLNKSKYDGEIDFTGISKFSKMIYENFLKYECCESFDLAIENYHLKNQIRKLKKENEKLKNRSLLSKIMKWSLFNG